MAALQEEPPFNVRRLLSIRDNVFNISGDVLALSSSDTDFATIEEWRVAIEWLAEQFGGEVEWEE